MTKKWFYPLENKCPLCSNSFKSFHAKNSALLPTELDSDFCQHYANGADPMEYFVVVCPHCFYAAEKSAFEKLPGQNKSWAEESYAKAREIAGSADFTGVRDESMVVLSFLLGIYWAQAFKSSVYYLGVLCHRLAWYYRRRGREDKELKALERAAQFYEQAYLKESSIPQKMGPGGFEYVIGELYRRAHKLDKAARWLSLSNENAKGKMLPQLRRMWEDAYEKVRYSKKEQ